MSALAIIGIVYGSGIFAGLCVSGALDLKFWNMGPYDIFGEPKAGMLSFVWPIALPWAIGRLIRLGKERKRLAAEDKRKWLEAPIP